VSQDQLVELSRGLSRAEDHEEYPDDYQEGAYNENLNMTDNSEMQGQMMMKRQASRKGEGTRPTAGRAAARDADGSLNDDPENSSAFQGAQTDSKEYSAR